MAKRRCIGEIQVIDDGEFLGSPKFVWGITMRRPRATLYCELGYKSRPSALLAAHKAADRLNIDIRSIDGEPV